MSAFAVAGAAGVGPVAALDVRVKFALLALASTLIFVWNSILLQLVLLAAMVALAFAASIRARTIGRLFVGFAPALVIITLVQGLWSPFGATPVFVVPDGVPLLGGLTIFTVEGLLFGLTVCCRILVPLIAFQILFMTSDPGAIVLGLVRLRVPYKVAFLVSATFRFVPLLLDEFRAMTDAQRLRGIDFDSFGILRKLTAMAHMLVPLIMICLHKAREMEIALEAKGFTGSPVRTYLNPGRAHLTTAEITVLVALAALLAAAVAARLATGFGGAVL